MIAVFTLVTGLTSCVEAQSFARLAFLKLDLDVWDDEFGTSLWTMKPDGSDARKVCAGFGFHAIAWLDDSHLVLLKDANAYRVNWQTSKMKRLPIRGAERLACDPAGQYVFFARYEDLDPDLNFPLVYSLYRTDAQGKHEQFLGKGFGSTCEIAADNQWLYFTVEESSHRCPELWRIKHDGSQAEKVYGLAYQELYDDSQDRDYDVAVYPSDGQQVIFGFYLHWNHNRTVRLLDTCFKLLRLSTGKHWTFFQEKGWYDGECCFLPNNQVCLSLTEIGTELLSDLYLLDLSKGQGKPFPRLIKQNAYSPTARWH